MSKIKLVISEMNNHVCRVYYTNYSLVRLKMCTIHCSAISVKTVHFSPAISRPVVIFGPSFSCPAFSVNPFPRLSVPPYCIFAVLLIVTIILGQINDDGDDDDHGKS